MSHSVDTHMRDYGEHLYGDDLKMQFKQLESELSQKVQMSL